MRAARLAAIALSVLCAAAAPVGCGGSGSDAQLHALQADPLGTHQPAGARQVSSSDETQSNRGLLGKPREAHVERLWAPLRSPDGAFEAAVQVARTAGWRVDTLDGERDGDQRVALLSKWMASGNASAAVTLLREQAGLPDGTNPPALSITLTHRRG